MEKPAIQVPIILVPHLPATPDGPTLNYIAQYPLSRCGPPIPEHLTEALLRPRARALRLTLEAGEGWEHNHRTDDAPGSDSDGETIRPRRKKEKHLPALPNPHGSSKRTLTSSSVTEQANYAIAIPRRDAIYITPAHAVLQMRPDMSHLDKKRPLETKSEGDQLEPVNVRFRKAEARPRTTAIGGLVPDEPWLHLRHHDRESEAAKKQFGNLIHREKCEHGPNMGVDKKTFAELLTGPERAASEQESVMYEEASGELPEVAKPSLRDQVMEIMKREEVIRHSQLLGRIGGESSRLIEIMKGVSWLVKGVWVVRSKHVTTSERMRKARDELVLMLFEGGIEVDSVVSVTREQRNRLLQGLAIEDNGLYVLKTGSDEAFEKENAQLVQYMKKQWEGHHGDGVVEVSKEQAIVLDENVAMRWKNGGSLLDAELFGEKQSCGQAGMVVLWALHHHESVSVERMKAIMRNEMNRPDERNEFKNGGITMKVLLDLLRLYGVPIDGNEKQFAIKSLGDEKLDKIRDFALERFRNHQSVNHDDLSVDKSDFNEVMKKIGRKKGKEWVGFE